MSGPNVPRSTASPPHDEIPKVYRPTARRLRDLQAVGLHISHVPDGVL